MSFYGYEARPADYGFVAAAGQQIGSGVAKYGEAKDEENRVIEQAKKVQLSKEQMNNVYQQIIEKTAKDYSEATGSDEITSISWASKHYYKPFEGETPSEFNTRMIASANKVDTALKDAKVKKFHSDTAANKPEPYQRPEGKVSVAQTPAAAQPGTPEFSKNPTSFNGLAGMQTQAMAEPLPSDIMTGPVETAQMKTERANQLGVAEDNTVAKDIQGTQDVQTGQDFAGGQTRAQYLAGMAARGIDVTGGAAKAIGDATPTEMQMQTDKTKRDIAAENQRLRAEYNRINKMRVNLYGNKLTSDQRMDIIAEKRKNQDAKDDVEKQIADIQQKMADKDYFGNIDETSRTNLNDQVKQLKLSSAIYDEIDSEFSGLLKEKGGVKPVPKEQPAPATQPKFKIISVK
jgi:hypothetical protein